MTRIQRLQVRQSECRQRINELLDKANRADGLSDDENTELDKLTREVQDLEPKLRAALVADADGDGADGADGEDGEAEQRADEQDAELREMQAIGDRARLGRYIAAALSGHNLDGAERELNEALGLRADGVIEAPYVMLLESAEEVEGQRADDDETYMRADAVTDLNAVNVGRTPGRFLERVFPLSAARFLGVTFESVPAGERVHHVFGSGATADTVARAGRLDTVAAGITAHTMDPHRLTAGYLFEVEDVARLTQLEPRLRADLNMSMSAQMDNAIINGDAGLSSANGLKGLTGAQNQELSNYTAATFANLFAEILTLLDGDYAATFSDCRVQWAPAALQKIKALESSAGSGLFLYNHLMASGLRQSSSTHVKAGAIAATNAYAYGSRGRGLPGAAIAAIWPGMQLIRDPYTKADAGQVRLTAITLWDFLILRAANFVFFEAKTLA